MDAVTQEAGVSKATVYAHFDSKQRLFEALIELGSESAIHPATAIVRSGGDPRRELHAFFSRFLDLLFGSGAYAWVRMLIAESPRHPKAAEHFYNCTIERITGVVERYLGELAGEGLFPAEEVRPAAEAFVAMVLLGPIHRVLLLGPQAIDIDATLTFGIDTLLARATPGGPDRRPQRVTSTN
jgi:TetR/AcrR family transcriptional repressor of mexJK operon